ncbi:MAG TPA: PH domain-containing protein [Jatrophihabitantaceae bacterium]
MDDGVGLSSPERAVRLRFGPDRRLSAVVFLLAIGALLLAITSSDGTGRVLFGLAAIVLAGYSIGDVLFWPRLAVDEAGVRIRTPLERADLPWADVDAIRADVRQRYGLRSVTLEIDAGQTLVVLSRRALGADPEAVAGAVRRLDPRRN